MEFGSRWRDGEHRTLVYATNGLYIGFMSQITEERTDSLFHALADRTRRDILRRVLSEGQSISALAANYNMSFAAVQKHVAVLERSGLLIKQRRGREQRARGDVQVVRSVAALLDEFEQVWRDRIDRIDELLKDG